MLPTFIEELNDNPEIEMKKYFQKARNCNQDHVAGAFTANCM